MTLYLQLAETLGSRIEQGLYRPGDRLPSATTIMVLRPAYLRADR